MWAGPQVQAPAPALQGWEQEGVLSPAAHHKRHHKHALHALASQSASAILAFTEMSSTQSHVLLTGELSICEQAPASQSKQWP